MKRLLLDVNVVLDILLDRRPHAGPACAVWAVLESGQARGWLPAHGLTTIHYLVARARGKQSALRAIRLLLSVCQVAVVDDHVIRNALALEWPDLEDAVCAASAAAAGCDAIISRGLAGFPGSPVTVLDPRAALTWLSLGSKHAAGHRSRGRRDFLCASGRETPSSSAKVGASSSIEISGHRPAWMPGPQSRKLAR